MLFLILNIQIFPVGINSFIEKNKISNDENQNYNIAIVIFGNSEAEISALKTIGKIGLPFTLFEYNVDLKSDLSNFDSIFYIGHGSQNDGGIKFEDKIIKYNELNQITGNRWSAFIACNSEVENDNTFSFSTNIDAILAMSLAIIHFGIINFDISLVIKALKVYSTRVNAIETGERQLELYVPNYSISESGHNIAIKRKSYFDSYWIRNPFNRKYYQYVTRNENQLWINLSDGAAWTWLTAIGGGGAALATIIGIIFTTAALAAAIVAFLLVVGSVLILNNKSNRYRGDVMMALGAEIVGFPTYISYFDHESSISSTTIPIPYDIVDVYMAMFGWSTSWTIIDPAPQISNCNGCPQ